VHRLWAVAWLAGSSGFSDESALEVAPPDRRPDSRPTAFTTMRYINRRSLPFYLYGNGNTDDKQIFLQEILEGRMTGKPTRGKRRIQLLSDLVDKKKFRQQSCVIHIVTVESKGLSITDSIYQDTVIQLVLPSF